MVLSSETAGSAGSSAPKRDSLQIAAILVGCIAIILIIILGLGLMPTGTSDVSPKVCGAKAVNYINTNMVQSGSQVTLASVRESRGLYEVWIAYNGNTFPVYATKDCGLLFTEIGRAHV